MATNGEEFYEVFGSDHVKKSPFRHWSPLILALSGKILQPAGYQTQLSYGSIIFSSDFVTKPSSHLDPMSCKIQSLKIVS